MNNSVEIIEHFLFDNPTLFDNDEDRAAFMMIAKRLLELLEEQTQSCEYETDYDGYIDDFYWEIYRPMIKQLRR